jgi:pyruvate dehydrogenase E1 component alpha subunit
MHIARFSKLPFTRLFSSIKVPLPDYDAHNLEKFNLPKEVETNREELLKIYHLMSQMRRLEVSCDGLYKNQEIRGFCHLYDGQEAVLAGIESSLTYEDCLITAYRAHCHSLTRGDSPFMIISELMGKSTGSAKGKGGSMHMYRPKNNFYGGNGIVGAQTSVGTGLAYALKYSGKKNVSVTMYGDGAANQGQLFEACNMAALWKLPVIYVCENNEYAMGTSRHRGSAFPFFHKRFPYIPGIKLEGHNFFHMKAGATFAKQYAIENGPIFIEAKTYRYHGHSMSDPGISYRSREEVAEVRKNRDPISFLKNFILEHKAATEDELKKIDADTKAEAEVAIEQARKAPLPDEKELISDVYINNDEHYKRAPDMLESYIPGGKKAY